MDSPSRSSEHCSTVRNVSNGGMHATAHICSDAFTFDWHRPRIAALSAKIIVAHYLASIGGQADLDRIEEVIIRDTYTEGGQSHPAVLARMRPFYKLVGDPLICSDTFAEGYDGSEFAGHERRFESVPRTPGVDQVFHGRTTLLNCSHGKAARTSVSCRFSSSVPRSAPFTSPASTNATSMASGPTRRVMGKRTS